MASNTLDDLHAGSPGRPSDDSIGDVLRMMLAPIASLRLTVTLFALAILLIFFGTLAQVGKDSWEVMDLYFRCPIAWVPLQIFFPKVFFPDMQPVAENLGFYFPGGFLIGGMMAANLLAAHGVRFKIQASGRRLVAGLAVLVIGALLGWLVVMGGSDKDIVEGVSDSTADLLWTSIKAALAALWLTILYGWWHADPTRPRERWGLGALAVVIGGALWLLLYFGSAASPDPSGMRILLQITKATLVSLVLLAGCVLAFRKRAGIVLLHAGVGLMIANELVVYSLHSEGIMRIAEGETTNFTEDIRTTELAVIDPADKTEDEVTVVPKNLLLEAEFDKKNIKSDFLPCDVEVLEYYPNSKVRVAGPHEPNLATAGVGLKAIAENVRPTSGVENSKEVDIPAAYVRLIDKKSHAAIGVYLVSMELGPDKFDVDGKQYELSLRFKRNYRPYSIELVDVRKDDYVGTDTPRNYSSDIKLIYPDDKGQRKVSIWMNNPLRYAGETFYQSGYHKIGGRELTTLQVVKNTGWMIPYLGCMIVVVGMLVQFGMTLLRFVKQREAEPQAVGASSNRSKKKARNAAAAAPASSRNWWAYGIPAATVVLLGAMLASQARMPKPVAGKFDFFQFGELPIVYEGRVKPFDTLARNTLRMLSGKQYYIADDGTKQPAVRWLLDLIAEPKLAFQQHVVRIDNPEVLNALQLSKREPPSGKPQEPDGDRKTDGDHKEDGEKKDAAKHSGSLYSLAELMPQIQELEKQAEKARDTDVHRLTTFQKKILELDKKTRMCALLMASFQTLELRPDHMREDLLAAGEQLKQMDSRPTPRVIPPESKDDQWQPFTMAMVRGQIAAIQGQPASKATVAWERMLLDYSKHDVAGFNQTVSEYRASLSKDAPKDLNNSKIDFEAMFNHAEPFFWACILDVTAFLFTCLAWFGFSRVLNRTALWLLVLTFSVHTLGLVARIYISGRPPVTNLYSSALFIGWAAMIFGIVFEAIFRLGIGNLIASVAGFATLVIAHFLSGEGDTFTVLQAVLDTQFWLATHVVCVTLGYAATFVAGLLGITYVIAGTLTPTLDREKNKILTRMIYGTICFAMFFSFFGTVLGGLWADDSWGRFWGWDPKENGALIIVTWNALVLHARWGGMIKDRGLAVLAMVGNIVTSWSWFGVNELGAGLHSYGFTEGVAKTLAIAVVVQLGLIGLGMLPKKLWPLYGRAPAATL